MKTKENVLKILLEAEDFVSGETLAESLGITRNSVWKAVTALRTDGFDIEAVTNKGYALVSEGTVLNELVMKKYLTSAPERKVHIFDIIDSTNNYAKKLASDGAPSGTTVVSDMQTAGKGRLDRRFVSPAGGSIYMSVILRPDTDLKSSQLITSCIAAAAAQAVDKVCGTDVKIKWVNDLYLNGKKICGILTEASINFESGGLDYAVAGIGINLRSIKETLPEELLEKATSIEDETGKIPPRSRLIAEILNNLDKYLDELESKSFLDEYRRRSFIIGKHVAVSKFSDERTALALGISDDAGLIVRYDDQTEEILNSGEARILPQG